MILAPHYDDIPIGVCILKHDRLRLEVIYANQALANMLSFSTRDFLFGRTLEEIWNSKDVDTLSQKLKSPNPPQDFMVPYMTENKICWALLTIRETIHNKELTYTIWATDVSASKESEEKLQMAVVEADALAQQKSNFLATMSHEIRTPMQSVYGILELIEQENPQDHIKEMVETAKASASDLLEILDDILDFAKMDADQMELDLFEVPIRTLAKGIIEALNVKVQGKNITLLDDIEDGVPAVIVGDPKRLRQIIMNLMSNAIKFTQEGSVIIRINRAVETISEPANGLALRVEIVDSGMGMSKDVCDRLFSPFTQADNSTSRKFGGTGLGLSICKKLVETMHGQIGVSSLQGIGSTFWFEIPTQEVGVDSVIMDLPNLEGLSILSVEDHPMGAKEIVKSLRSMGAQVESCTTCQEAIDLCKRRPFDVGLIDHGLPDGTGLDLIRKIMDIRPFMGLIMYTVRDDSGLQHTLQSLGVTYLSKPAGRLGLGETIKDAAGKVKRNSISGPRKMLIAEDTPSVRDVLKRQLDKIGVSADFVTNGIEAFNGYKTGKYGLILTDLHMPEMDGYEVVKQIREIDENFPVLVLTADVQLAQRQVYMKHGFDECILKPVSLGQFRRMLIRWGIMEEEDYISELGTNNPEGVEDETITLPPAIDKNAVISQMGGFDEGTIDMLKMFVDMTAPLMEKIKDANTVQDKEMLKELGHSLKGAARSACANILGDIASELQDQSAAGKDVSILVQKSVSEFERVKEEINAL